MPSQVIDIVYFRPETDDRWVSLQRYPSDFISFRLPATLSLHNNWPLDYVGATEMS